MTLKEVRALAEKGMTRAEFEMARQQLKAGYILGQESTSARMNAAGRRLLLLNRTRSEEEVIRAIDGLTFEGRERTGEGASLRRAVRGAGGQGRGESAQRAGYPGCLLR